jgi:signal transduction histidine kinase
MSLRKLLFLGFGGVFGLWLFSAYALSNEMAAADARSLEIRSRFLRNEQLLSTIRAQVLVGAVSLRDALLDSPASLARTQAQIGQLREDVDRALRGYVPWPNLTVEQDEWVNLQSELRAYWDSFGPALPASATGEATAPANYLRDNLTPKREAVMRISDRIHALNRGAFSAEISELAGVRGALRRRVWLTSLAAVALGLAIAFFASRAAGRLESRIRDQHNQEWAHKLELGRLSAKLLQAQEDERRRIARELHDEIGQALSALKLELAVVEREAGAGGESLAEARSIAEKTLQSVRDISQLLHPSMLDDLGLVDTATWYVRAFSRRSGIRTDLMTEHLDPRLPPEIEACLYRVLQEALTNVARHAEATTCSVRIERRDRTVHLTVTDNGRGFQPEHNRAAADRGLGLVGVRERVTGFGGSLRIDSVAGVGTTLATELPLPEKP